MRFTQFGRTGLRVSELCLGTMTFGPEIGWGADAQDSRRIFDLFVEAGGNFIDTANVYTAGTSEKLVGEFVHAERHRFVVGTKYSLSTRLDDPNGGGNHRKNLVQSVENSLKAMQLDYIDILWLHAWDFLTPEDEVLRALDDLVRVGKILYTGISDTPAWVIARSNAIADLRGWTAFGGIQIPYSLVERTPEREFFPMARSLDLTITAWASLAGGLLTGKYRGASATELSGRMLLQQGIEEDAGQRDRKAVIVETLCGVADDIGSSPGETVIAWVMQRPVPVIPLIGARTPEQMQANLRCLQIRLSDVHIARLDDVSRIDRGFPHDFLETPAMIALVHGANHPALNARRWYGK